MQHKHWLAILAPYAIVGAAAIATAMKDSPAPWAAVAGGLILAAIAHRNLLATPPTKTITAKTEVQP